MNKAFTLVELLAVIVVVGLLVSITSISVTSSIKKSKEKLSNIQISNLESATSIWCSNNISKIELDSGTSKCYYITVKQLKDADLIGKVSDPTTNIEYPEELKIKIIIAKTKSNDKDIDIVVNPSSVNGCTQLQ